MKRASSFWFLLQMLVGVMMMYLTAVFFVAETSKTMCGLTIWFGCLGFVITFSPLFVKSYRLWRIFYSTKIRKVTLPDTELALYVLVIVAIDVVILAVWEAEAPFQPSSFSTALVDGNVRVTTTCSTANNSFVIASAAYLGGILLCGSILCFLIRNLQDEYNESPYITAAIYNTTFSASVVAAILAVIGDQTDAAYVMITFGLLWVATVTLVVLFIPKLFKVASYVPPSKNSSKNSRNGAPKRQSCGTGTSGNSFSDSRDRSQGTTAKPRANNSSLNVPATYPSVPETAVALPISSVELTTNSGGENRLDCVEP
jgi:hypothetical protein